MRGNRVNGGKSGIDIAVFISLFLFLIWRAKYGYCFDDEPFLLTLAQRIYQGDILLIDEWHGCQNFGLILLPFYAIYHVIVKTNDGIMLCFRYIYCVIWIITLIVMYKKLSRSYGLGALVAIIYMGLFSPLDYMTLSYTSVSLMCVLIMATMAYSDVIPTKKQAIKKGFIYGLLITISTLCYPYFAGIYVIYSISVAIYIMRNVLSGIVEQRNKAKNLLYFNLTILCVCVLCAGLYAVWIFSNASFERVLSNIKMIFTDPQHQSKGIIAGIIQLIRQELQAGRVFYGGMSLLSVAAILLGKNRKKYRIIILAAALLLWSYCQMPVLISPYAYKNIQMKGIAVTGILFFILLEKRTWKLFISFYSLSIAYMIVGYLNSNTGVTVTAMCMSVAGVAAMLMLINLAKELKEQYRDCGIKNLFAMLIAGAFAVGQIALEIDIRLRYTYYDDTLSALTETISMGSQRD